MNKSALSLFFLIITFKDFSNEAVQKVFKSKKDSDKVSFFRRLSNEEKIEDIYFFQSECQLFLQRSILFARNRTINRRQ